MCCVYNMNKIKSFKNKETATIYKGQCVKTLPDNVQRAALRKLILIDNAGSLQEMKKYIDLPSAGEILYEEFMQPMGISAYRLASDIGVPVSRIQDILHDRRKISVDTSLRLAKYFSVSDEYFLNIQNDIDIRKLKRQIQGEIDRIQSRSVV